MADILSAQLRITTTSAWARSVTRRLSEGLIERGSNTATMLGEKLRDQPNGFWFAHDTDMVIAAVARPVEYAYRAPVLAAMNTYCAGRYVFAGKVQTVDATTSVDIDLSVDVTTLAQEAANAYALSSLAQRTVQETTQELVERQRRIGRLHLLWGRCASTIEDNQTHNKTILEKIAKQKAKRVEEGYRYAGAALLRVLWWLTNDHLEADPRDTQYRLESRPSPGDSKVIPPDVLAAVVRYGEGNEEDEDDFKRHYVQTVIGEATIPHNWWRQDIVYLLNAKN